MSASATRLDRTRVPEPGPLRPFHFPAIVRGTLGNGLPVLVARTGALPVVTWSLLVEAGGVHEDPGRAGLATLTGSLLESGAGDWTAAEIAEALEGLGTQVGAGVSWDGSHLGLTVLASRLQPATEILAVLTREPTFPEAEVERIRHEQLAAIVQRRAEPRGLANEMFARFLFDARSPFHRPLGGSDATVGGLSRADAVAFHTARYTPAAAALVVAGDIEPEHALALAERRYGDWAGPAPADVSPSVAPASDAPRVVLVDRPGSVQSEIRMGHVAVARDTPDYFPIQVMNTILGGAFTSRLNLNLRERHGFTYSVSSGFAMRKAPGPFLVSTAVQTETTAPAIREVLGEIAALRAGPVSPAELADARAYLAGTFPLRLQTTDGVASRLAEIALFDLPDDYFDGYRDRILEVSADDVLRVAGEHLHPDRLAIVVVGDVEAVRAPVEALGVAPVRRVAADEAD